MSLLTTLKAAFQPLPRLAPADVADRIRTGTAVLVDVREPAEWNGGVAQHAALLPLSDLAGARRHWREFLASCRDREVLCYCASGNRSGTAARILTAEGIRAYNAGALSEWSSSGWPIVKPTRSA